MKATSNKAWIFFSPPSGQIWVFGQIFSPPSGQIWVKGQKKFALFRGHLIFFSGKKIALFRGSLKIVGQH